MQIFPAIDILEKKVVRLRQGDYTKSQIFSEDPEDIARQFFETGATNLHIIDLDGARVGEPKNQEIITKIAATLPLFIECGGGIRTEKVVEQYLNAGIDRIILGTSALKDQVFTEKMLKQYGDRIAIGVDARDSKVAIEGWLSNSEVDSIEFCYRMRDIGASYIIYTDISKDGTGTGTNIPIYMQLSKITDVNFTASGGISTLEELNILKDIGIYAAILGKSIYTGQIDLKKAIEIQNN